MLKHGLCHQFRRFAVGEMADILERQHPVAPGEEYLLVIQFMVLLSIGCLG